MTANPQTPRGVRNANPGNIREDPNDRTKWLGERAGDNDPAFEEFDDPVYGLRALMKILLKYRRDYGLSTVAKIIDRWAPPSENATSEYAAAVARRLGVGVDTPLALTREHLITVARAIVIHENGRPPAGWPADWYSDAQYEKAADLALG